MFDIIVLRSLKWGYAVKKIKSLEKVCSILDCFSELRPEWSLTELASQLDIPKTTLTTLLGTLQDCGYLERDPRTGRYHLGLRFFELGFVVRSEMKIRTHILPALEELQRETGEIVYLTIPRNGKVLYLEALYPSVRLVQYSTAGRLADMHATGVGKAMLAYMPKREVNAVIARWGLPKKTPNTLKSPEDLQLELDKIRERGYAVDWEENELTIRCVAVAIRNSRNESIGAISVSGPSVNFTPERIPQYAAQIQQVVSGITRFSHLLPKPSLLADQQRYGTTAPNPVGLRND